MSERPQLNPLFQQVHRIKVVFPFRIHGPDERDLLDLTHIESGQKQREITDVDLSEVARSAMEMAAPEAAERNITIELHTDSPATIRGDADEIEIIFNNLISNAVKYNRDAGRVDVTLSGDEEALRITVADTGIGMTQEEADRLFGEFVRIKNSKTRNILGSGLGLSIVKKLAMLYGGTVSVESQPDVGTTFTVVLRHAPSEVDS